MKALQDLAEMVVAGQELAEDQWGPPLGKYLGSSGNGAELPVSRHHQIVALPAPAGKY
jgi:hypothetical protein